MDDTAVTTALGDALRHLLNVLRWDEQQQCYRTPYWFHRGDTEDAKRALAQWRFAAAARAGAVPAAEGSA